MQKKHPLIKDAFPTTPIYKRILKFAIDKALHSQLGQIAHSSIQNESPIIFPKALYLETITAYSTVLYRLLFHYFQRFREAPHGHARS